MSDAGSAAEVLDRCFALISANEAYGEALSQLTSSEVPFKNRGPRTAALDRDLVMEQTLMQPSGSSHSQSLIDIMNEALLKVLAGKHAGETKNSSEGDELEYDTVDETSPSSTVTNSSGLLKRKWRSLVKDRVRLQGFALGLESATLTTYERTSASALATLYAEQERRISNLMLNCRPPLVYCAKKGDSWNGVLDRGQFYYFEEMGTLRAGVHAIVDMNDVWETLIDHAGSSGLKTSSCLGSTPLSSIQMELASTSQGYQEGKGALQLCWNIVHHFARREEKSDTERLHQGQYILSQSKRDIPTAQDLISFEGWIAARQFARDTIPPSLRGAFYTHFLRTEVRTANCGDGQQGNAVASEVGIVPWELALAYEAHSVAQPQDYFIFSDSIRHALSSVYKSAERGSKGPRVPVLGAALRMAPLAFVFGEATKLSQAAKCMDDALWNPLFNFTGVSNYGIAETDLSELLVTFERLVWDVAPAAAQNCARLGLRAANLFLPLIGTSFVSFLTPVEVLTVWDLVFGWSSAMALAVIAASIFLHVSPQLASARTVSELRMPLHTHEADCIPCEAASQCSDDMGYRLRGLVSELRRRLNRVEQ